MATKGTAPQSNTPENPEPAKEEFTVSSIEQFQTHFAAAFQIAATDLPQVLAQHREGSNPEHQKQITNLERVIADGTLDAAVLAILQTQVESMKPQLSWKQSEVADMLAVFKVRATTEADQKLANDIATEILRVSAAGSGKGKKAGTGVTRVSGAAKELQLACTLCDFKQANRRSDSATAPSHIANDIRKHLQDPHGFQFNTKQLEETVRQVVMGEIPRATLKNEKGEPVFQIAPVTGEVPAADNGAVASAPVPEPETV
jgi:hypothetical protein